MIKSGTDWLTFSGGQDGLDGGVEEPHVGLEVGLEQHGLHAQAVAVKEEKEEEGWKWSRDGEDAFKMYLRYRYMIEGLYLLYLSLDTSDTDMYH